MKFAKKPDAKKETRTSETKQLATQSLHSNKIAFAGSLTETVYPLAMHQSLRGEEIKLFVALKNLTIDGRVVYELNQKELAKLLDTSQPTISRRMSVLRIKRWVTLISNSQSKNLKGRNSYLVNNETMSITDTIERDNEYLVFLQENLSGKQPRIRQLSKQELFNVPKKVLEQQQLYLIETGELRVDEVDSPLCTDELRENTPDSPLCTDELRENAQNSPLCTDELRENTPDSPLYTDELRENAQNSPLCTDELRENVPDSPLCTDELRENVPDSPLCTDELRENVPDSPLCTNELRENAPDIYNTARVRAPTHLGISFGDDSNTTSSGEGFSRNQKSSHQERQGEQSGCSGDKFLFFDTNPIIREILFDLNAHPKFGKKATHAICNCLKAGHYQTKNGEAFAWQASEEAVVEMLVVLLNETPEYVIAYLTKLILSDRNGQFYLKPKQQSLLTTIHRRIDPTYQPDNFAKPQQKKTAVQQLFDFIYEQEEVKAFTPVHLAVGKEITALFDLPFWKAQKGQKGVVKQFDYQTKDFESSLYLQFDSLMDIAYYGQICKGLELGVIELCD